MNSARLTWSFALNLSVWASQNPSSWLSMGLSMVYLNKFSLGMGRDKPCIVPPVPRLVGSPWCQSVSGSVLPTKMPLAQWRITVAEVSASKSWRVFHICFDRWVLNTTWMEGFCQWYLNHEPGSSGMQSGLLASPCSACFQAYSSFAEGLLWTQEAPFTSPAVFQAEVSVEGVGPPCPPPAKLLPKNPRSYWACQEMSMSGSVNPAGIPQHPSTVAAGERAALLPCSQVCCRVFTLHLWWQEWGIHWSVQVKMDCNLPSAVSIELISACMCLWQDWSCRWERFRDQLGPLSSAGCSVLSGSAVVVVVSLRWARGYSLQEAGMPRDRKRYFSVFLFLEPP